MTIQLYLKLRKPCCTLILPPGRTLMLTEYGIACTDACTQNRDTISLYTVNGASINGQLGKQSKILMFTKLIHRREIHLTETEQAWLVFFPFFPQVELDPVLLNSSKRSHIIVFLLKFPCPCLLSPKS